MEAILIALPVFYIYWASGLIVWSILQAGLTANILRLIIKQGKECRRTDILIIGSLLIGAALFGTSVFMIPQIMALFSEIALVVALWYSVFMLVVSQFNISSMIHIHKTL